jgi:hypothetical protein
LFFVAKNLHVVTQGGFEESLPERADYMSVEFYVGRRLSYDSRLCTVRYKGEVQGTKGEWLGVEWDDPTRGKHAGEHQGVKYFDCKHGIFSLLKSPTFGLCNWLVCFDCLFGEHLE